MWSVVDFLQFQLAEYLQIKKKFEYVNVCKEIGYGNSKAVIFYTTIQKWNVTLKCYIKVSLKYMFWL